MAARNLKRLNAFPELKTNAGIDTVRQAVLVNAAPPGMTPIQTAKFAARYLNNWVVVPLLPAEGGLPIHGANRLRYRPQFLLLRNRLICWSLMMMSGTSL